MLNIKCPVCDSNIEVVGEVELGQPVRCPFCLSRYEVVWLYPLEVSLLDDRTATEGAAESTGG